MEPALAREPDTHAATAVAIAAGMVLLLPVAAADRELDAGVWPDLVLALPAAPASPAAR